MPDIEQMKKIVPLMTCEIPFSQHVCESVFGVSVTDLNFWDLLLLFCVFLGLIVVFWSASEQPTASPPKWARVYCGF